VLADRLTVGGDELDVAYADIFVVVREGETGPGPNDWEVTAQTRGGERLIPGEHDLVVEALDGTTLSGRALLRFSDGRHHLFRGDGTLTGFSVGPTWPVGPGGSPGSTDSAGSGDR
jgi:hypothetical protein